MAEKEALTELVGTVEQIVFKNSENGYTVIDIFNESGELITAVGIMPYVNEGDTVMLAGRFVNHQTFGKQFAVEYFDRTLPSEEGDILRYLSSGSVKGIGPKTAVRIVGKYGSDSFDIIENHPEWLAEIPGISPKKATEISSSFKEQFGVRNIMLLGRGELSATVAMKIFQKYKGRAVELLRENPYILCEELNGIGFEKCDRLAAALGVEYDSPFRIRSGFIYLLNYNAARNGYTYLPYELLANGAYELLSQKADGHADTEAEKQKLCAELDSMINDGKLICIEIDGKRAVYTPEFFRAEKFCSDKLKLLDRVCTTFSDYDVRLFIERTELESNITYAEMQRKAIASAATHGVMILTGGPGTGKTTVIKAAIRIFGDIGLRVCLAAPTGRAAKRMSEATGVEARTIHRLLESEKAEGESLTFRKNENDLLEYDAVIIDEASMIDINLFYALLRAIKPGARLMLIGDSNQLPSVGAGNVLADLIGSGRFCTVCLNEIFRQAKESLIVTNAHAILRGELPELKVRDRDFFFLARKNDVQIAQTVAELCDSRLPKTYGEAIRQKLQVISPSKKGGAGCDELNRTLQSRLNPADSTKREHKSHGVIFREGDRVMQIKNDYELEWEKNGGEGSGIFNGDIGRIESINTLEETMIINFDERIVVYGFDKLDELDHSYAITVHKSQGSEYPIVILPLGSAAPMLMTRNLLYTAITRAQEMVILVGREETVAAMVKNDRRSVRYTGLANLIGDDDESGSARVCGAERF